MNLEPSVATIACGYVKIDAGAAEVERSTCGFRQRLLKKDDGAPASISRLRIHDAKPHWHRITHEYYFVLDGAGAVIVDGEYVPVQPGDCVWIKPGHLHHAQGGIEALIFGIPPFDPADMFFDTPPADFADA